MGGKLQAVRVAQRGEVFRGQHQNKWRRIGEKIFRIRHAAERHKVGADTAKFPNEARLGVAKAADACFGADVRGKLAPEIFREQKGPHDGSDTKHQHEDENGHRENSFARPPKVFLSAGNLPREPEREQRKRGHGVVRQLRPHAREDGEHEQRLHEQIPAEVVAVALRPPALERTRHAR